MARIRTIKPEFWIDERVGECSPTTRLLFIATWNFADDNGNLERSAKQLKAQAMPYDNIDCEALILELIRLGLLEEYEVNGHKYLHVSNFEKHQKIEKKSAARHPLPASSPNTSQPVGIVREGKVGEEEGNNGKGTVGAPVLIRNRPDSAIDVSQFVKEGLGISGREHTWTIEEAVGLSMKSFDLPAMGAAAQIVTSWQEYEQADIEFRSGPASFLKNGLFLSKSRWRLKGDVEQKQGRLEQLRALRKANGQDGRELAEFDGGSAAGESKGGRVPETL